LSKILFVNPNKWGRGITSIWIASHAAILKKTGHDVKLFDSTFYSKWTDNETKFNTLNSQYKESNYEKFIDYNDADIYEDLQNLIDNYKPDIIFGSAISSHIHGEGEYVNIQYFSQLIGMINTNSVIVAAGLQPTAKPEIMYEKFKNVDLFIRGESEFILLQLADNSDIGEKKYSDVPGLIFLNNGELTFNGPQKIITDMDEIGYYDYSLFDQKVFFRPYNGEVVRAVDYELSRGCIYACDYCVETVIQKYYGFKEISSKGVLKNSRSYIRSKSANHIFEELLKLNKEYGIKLIRCQDTNFLTINKNVLLELAEIMNKSDLDIMLYIETRPEGINERTIELLKKLKVDGVGMGIELASQNFREEKLNRFANQDRIINAFRLLRQNNIRRTAYNIIGLPEEDEQGIINTIQFNTEIEPDNVTVSFYSPYMGTAQEIKASELNYFTENENNVDGQLRTLNKSNLVNSKLLEFYKKYFVYFVKNGFDDLNRMKKDYDI